MRILGRDSFVVEAEVLVRPGEHATFAESSASAGFAANYEYRRGMALANGDDEIIIQCASPMVEIDRVEWDGGPVFPDPNGLSMSLPSASEDPTANDLGANWCESPVLPQFSYDGSSVGSPGTPNPSCP